MKAFTEGAKAASPLRASKILRVVALIAPLGALLTLLAAAGRLEAQQTGTAAPNDAAVQARVDSLLKQMTTDEKIGQLNQVFALSTGPTMEKRLRAGQLGSLLMLSDPALINKLQHAAVEGSRLHVPLLFGLDVIHGLRTIFPVPIGLAASWDPATVENAQAVAAKEARAVGVHWTFAPMVDIARDPRCRIPDATRNRMRASVGLAPTPTSRGFRSSRDPSRKLRRDRRRPELPTR
jgi:Glycosyl hydrolase family 3 N terminal domain